MTRVWPRTLGLGVVALAIVGFLGLMAWGLATKAPVTGQSGFTRVGKPAPDFVLSLFQGGEFYLSRYRGHPVVINFWASWCLPCRQEAPVLERAWRAYRERGVMFVGVNIQDREEDALRYLEEFGITYPNGPDKDGKITVDYGVVGIPVTFFVGREGLVARRWVGAIPEEKLVTWVEEILAGVAPAGEVEGRNPQGFFQLER